MPNETKKFRFLLVQAFSLPKVSKHLNRPMAGSKVDRMKNYNDIKHLLADVDTSSPEDLANKVKFETVKWSKVIKDAGIRAE